MEHWLNYLPSPCAVMRSSKPRSSFHNENGHHPSWEPRLLFTLILVVPPLEHHSHVVRVKPWLLYFITGVISDITCTSVISSVK